MQQLLNVIFVMRKPGRPYSNYTAAYKLKQNNCFVGGAVVGAV